ncbi:MAG: ECF transporter S component [Eubacteriales bacterium]|nr:ECF transporter S component [Eubacteriales bacterium]
MKTKTFNARSITLIGMLGALSTVLMMFNFPLPFAPAFLKFDIAELPALFAGFFLGPLSGCAVVVIKILLKLVMEGTDTAFVGEFMNVVGSSVFVLSASLIYKFRRTKAGAVIGLSFASVLVSILFIYLNIYVGFPMYERLYGMSLGTIIEMGAAVNPFIHDTFSMMIFAFLPFNLLKHGVTSAVTYLIYKRCGAALRSVVSVGHTIGADSKASGVHSL